MREIIDAALAERVILILGAVSPVVGAAIGAVAGFGPRKMARCAVTGGLVGLFGTVVFLMWKIYGAVTAVFGLDSTTNLVVQMLIFAAAGAGLGAVIFKVTQYLRGTNLPGRSETPAETQTGGT